MVVGEILLNGVNVPSPVVDQNTPELVYVIVPHQSMAGLIAPEMHQKPRHAMTILVQVRK